jgi:Phospholipid-translocating P-type ATPase C-terminal
MFVRIAMLTYTWTYLTHAFFWFSVLFYVVFLVSYQYYYNISYTFYGVTNEMAGRYIFWLLCLLVPSASGSLELAIRFVSTETDDWLINLSSLLCDRLYCITIYWNTYGLRVLI